MSERERDVGEWVEIVEPSSKKHLFANLSTGEIAWDVQPGVKVRKYSDQGNQWWELFDRNTKRFYYYNVASQRTVWHKPSEGDIIPLAKLQSTKEKTKLTEEMDQTAAAIAERELELGRSQHRRTASARMIRETDRSAQLPPLKSRRNQSQRMARGERWDGSDRSAGNVASKHADPNQTTAIYENQPLSERSVRADHLRSKSVDKGHEHASKAAAKPDIRAVNMKDSPDVVPNQKQGPITVQNRAFVLASNDALQHLELGSHDLGSSCLMNRDFYNRVRTGNSSLDSGIAADGSFVPSEVSPHSSEDRRQSSGVNQRLSYIDESRCTDASNSVPVVQMTPGSQRRAFPRTNPNFVANPGGTSLKKPNNQNSSSEIIPPFNSPHHHGNRNLVSSSSALQFGCGLLTNTTDNDDVNLSHMVRKSDGVTSKKPDSVAKPSAYSRKPADPGTCQTSFAYRRFPLESGNSCLASAQQLRSFDSAVSFSGSECDGKHSTHALNSGEHTSGLCHSSELQRHQPGTKITRDGSEERNRTRRNSEPDYANLQETSVAEGLKETHDVSKKSRGDLGRTRSVRAKAEPIYANELLTGRGCLTHEDRFHMPPHSGHHDNSLSSTGSSTISTPSPKLRARTSHFTAETRHMSLRRKKLAEKPMSETSKSFIDKSRSLHSELIYQRPQSISAAVDSEVDSIVTQVADALMLRAGMEQFLVDNLNEHRKGILGKAVPVSNMLTWTKDPIQKPMIRTENKMVKKEAPEVFKLIQTYMGDRKSRDSSSSVALELTNKGWTVPELRDEIYIQLCRQTTRNTRDESLFSGWELLGICLSFFPPSTKFQSFLEDYIYQALDSCDPNATSKLCCYATSCLRRLEKICQTGAARKPSADELERCRKSLLESSMFGNTLDDVMELQKYRYSTYHLPWIQVTLSEALLSFKGTRLLEGIFRVPGDVDEVNALKAKLDQWEMPDSRTDPHVLASVLKLWFRELYEPLIPDEYYNNCMENFDNPKGAIEVVGRLPTKNMLVLSYLIRFLQKFASPEYSAITKMDASNLAMVMAPNCLRCPTNNPQMLFENARKEMSFMRTLIQNLDASGVTNLK